MSFSVGIARRIQVGGALPPGWRETTTAGGPDAAITVEGPAWVGDRRPRLVATIESGASESEAVAARARVEVACRDRWPHPVWGSGVVHEGVRIEGDVALAHDVYLFHDGRNGIRVELECELTSLFEVEEDVALILDSLTGGGVR